MSDDEVHNYGVVVQDADGRITEFQEKPSLADAKSRMINTGIYIFEPEILLCIPKDGAYDIGSELFPLLAQQGGLFGVTLSSPWQWLDIAKVPDLHDGTMQAMRGARQPRPWCHSQQLWRAPQSCPHCPAGTS